jgi:hypothetical protein
MPIKKDKEEVLKQNIDELRGNIGQMLDEIEPINNLFPTMEELPGLDFNIEQYDYEKELEIIKIDAKDTLECLANLYLNEDNMKNKNINNIIKNDALQLSDLNFSISCARRAMIKCLTQIDQGVNDPEMFKAVSLFQKEMRDTIKMANELQKKMKEFYKELKEEITTINTGPEQIEDDPLEKKNMTVIGDPKQLNDLIDKWKENPDSIKNP